MKRRTFPALLALLLALPAVLSAEVVQQHNFSDWIGHDAIVELAVDPAKVASDRLRLMIGSQDYSALLEFDGHWLRLRPQGFVLPSGEQELVLYRLDDGDQWQELQRLPLRVLTPRGFESAQTTPRLQLGGKSQVHERARGNATPSQRPTYADLTGQGGVSGQWLRGPWRLSAQGNAVGSSYRQEALRFASRADRAPKIDLADYLLEAGWHEHRLALGHVGYGNHPLLIDNLAHRGLRYGGSTPAWEQQFGVAMMRGSAIVGWSDLLGFIEREHRVLATSWSARPWRAALAPRIELTYTQASVLPENSFDVGEVRDAERSSGWGLRATAAAERLEYDLLAARSRYRNPDDPLLSGDSVLVPVREVEQGAASARLLWRMPLNVEPWAGWPLTAEVEGNWQRTDPLYRTVGAFVQPDHHNLGGQLRLGLGMLAMQISAQHSHDNLDDLDSLLTTKTAQRSLAIQAPLPAIVGERLRPFLPDLSASWLRVHQRAGNTPDPFLSGFDPSHLPDQMNTNWSLSANWRWRPLDLGINYAGFHQDNRQPGRERSDFLHGNLNAQLNWRLHERFGLGLTWGRGRNHDYENTLTRYTHSRGVTGNWSITDRLALALGINQQREHDSAGNQRRRSLSSDGQLSWSFELARGDYRLPGQWFLRWGRQRSSFIDQLFGIDDDNDMFAVNTGLSFTFF